MSRPATHSIIALSPLLLCAGSLLSPAAALATGTRPEITRAPAAPQAVGVAHALRTIPEACARIQGSFTGDASAPYRFEVVRTSAACQPRARIVDAATVDTAAPGWIFNDLIRVPSAACPARQAVVRVWRRPADATPPPLDAQGRSRIYLRDATAKARAAAPALPVFAVAMAVEGSACEP